MTCIFHSIMISLSGNDYRAFCVFWKLPGSSLLNLQLALLRLLLWQPKGGDRGQMGVEWGSSGAETALGADHSVPLL